MKPDTFGYGVAMDHLLTYALSPNRQRPAARKPGISNFSRKDQFSKASKSEEAAPYNIEISRKRQSASQKVAYYKQTLDSLDRDILQTEAGGSE